MTTKVFGNVLHEVKSLVFLGSLDIFSPIGVIVATMHQNCSRLQMNLATLKTVRFLRKLQSTTIASSHRNGPAKRTPQKRTTVEFDMRSYVMLEEAELPSKFWDGAAEKQTRPATYIAKPYSHRIGNHRVR